METYSVNIALPSHVAGDQWVGIESIGPVVVKIYNGAGDLVSEGSPAFALTKVVMRFEHPRGERYTLSSDAADGADGTIVIDNVATWEAHIPATDDFVHCGGQWDWTMKFHSADGLDPLTFYHGTLSVASEDKP